MGNLIEAIITELSRFIVSMISTFGYTGIFLTMAIESACIPLPSEIIMPFAGYLVASGQFTMLGVTLAGAIGNVAGSVVCYPKICCPLANRNLPSRFKRGLCH